MEVELKGWTAAATGGAPHGFVESDRTYGVDMEGAWAPPNNSHPHGAGGYYPGHPGGGGVVDPGVSPEGHMARMVPGYNPYPESQPHYDDPSLYGGHHRPDVTHMMGVGGGGHAPGGYDGVPHGPQHYGVPSAHVQPSSSPDQIDPWHMHMMNQGDPYFMGMPPAMRDSHSKRKRRRVITTDQRKAANIRERRRMYQLNDSFDVLRKRVPTFAYEKKLSRIETLKLAVTYIGFMSELLDNNGEKCKDFMDEAREKFKDAMSDSTDERSNESQGASGKSRKRALDSSASDDSLIGEDSEEDSCSLVMDESDE